jgi:phospholipid-translocating ATPase
VSSTQLGVVFIIDLLTAPRFLVKSISTSYLPLDRDIVREMWVYGDLKDRLGIKHRKARKRDNIEGAPMFHQPHARSQSEVSVVYESGRTSTTQRYLDFPPEMGQQTQSPSVQPVELRQRIPNDGTSPTSVVGQNSLMAYAQPRSTPPMQNMPTPSYEMQVRHPPELTNASYQTADEDWELEPNSRSRTPDDRYSPGQAL